MQNKSFASPKNWLWNLCLILYSGQHRLDSPSCPPVFATLRLGIPSKSTFAEGLVTMSHNSQVIGFLEMKYCERLYHTKNMYAKDILELHVLSLFLFLLINNHRRAAYWTTCFPSMCCLTTDPKTMHWILQNCKPAETFLTYKWIITGICSSNGRLIHFYFVEHYLFAQNRFIYSTNNMI